jgi:acetylornithine deacetylase/succinyl-diaminopimelate desuccinylase-like protein
LHSTGEAFSFHTRFEAPPFAIPDGHPWPAAILAASRRHAPAATFAAMPCATEAAHLGLHNIPTVVFGPGRLAAAHAKDESVPLGEVLAARDILLDALA